MSKVAQNQLNPFPQPRAPWNEQQAASQVRGNDNQIGKAFNAHDADATIHVQSSLASARPAAGVAGRFWYASDTNAFSYDNGSSWQDLVAASASAVAHSLTAGTHLAGGPFDGSAAVTLTTDGTSANMPSTLVARDASGNVAVAALSATSGTVTTAAHGDAVHITNGGTTPQSAYLYTDGAYAALANGAALTGQAVVLSSNTTELFVGGTRVAYATSAGLYSAGDVGVVGQVQMRTGSSAWSSGTSVGGGLAQQSGGAVGFNILTPTADYGSYLVLVAGKDAATGGAPSNAWLDQVVFNATSGWAPTAISSTTTLGSPGARTYSNATGTLHLAVASGTTWYVDLFITKLDS